MTVRAIETEYRGTLYRSRLEARWAATFDLLGIPYCYEPFDFAGYVPDFMLTGQHPALVEVRPVCTKDEFEQVAESIEQRLGVRGWDEDFLILGALVVPIYGERDLGSSLEVPCGWMADAVPTYDGNGKEWCWAWGLWVHCYDCPQGTARFCHSLMSYSRRPCAHYPGGDTDPPKVDLHEVWGRAHQMTRWSPRFGG